MSAEWREPIQVAIGIGIRIDSGTDRRRARGMSTNKKQMPGSEDPRRKIGGRLRRRLGWTIGCPDSGIVCRSREP